jgi:hypothetical protein
MMFSAVLYRWKVSSYNNYDWKALIPMKIHRRFLLPCAAIAFLALALQTVKATPCACEASNNNGTMV